ncbi:MAG TPA: pilus assembly protein TadG-related protein [Acidimicrobiales bacterium]|nr:pilus assembly protein TadG-related protein [Acidimicrobiales bacterium]
MRRASAGTRRPGDERGAILIISTIGVVVAVIATALSVDLGRLAQERRRNQKVADLAALDAVHDLAQRQPRAEASAARNEFPTGPGYSVVADLGKMVAGSFVVDPAGDAVRVTVTSPFDNAFLPGSRTVSASAIAKVREDAGFSIGSSVARVNGSVNAPLLNRILEPLIGASSGSLTLDAVGYQGLSAGSVKLGDIAGEMGFGTVNELLTSNVKLLDLIRATATVLDNNGDVLAVQVNQIADRTNNSQTLTLGDMIKVTQGAEGSAAGATVNVLQLITGSAQVANKGNLLTASNINNVPVTTALGTIGTLGTSMNLKVIEPPQIYIGPEGGSVTTSQVEVTFRPVLDVPLSLPAPVGGLVKATGEMPVKVVSGAATGTMSEINCSGANQGIKVGVDTESATSSVGSTVTLRLLTGAVAGSVNVQGAATGADAPPTSLSFAWPGEFSPTAPSKTTPGSPVNMDMTATSTGNVDIDLGLLTVTLGAGVVANAVLDAALPILDQLEVRALGQELAALGIAVGIADVAALKDAFDPTACGVPGLIA